MNIHQACECKVVESGLYLVGYIQAELLQVVVKHQLYPADRARHNNLLHASEILAQYSIWADLAGKALRGDTIPIT